MTDHEPTPQVVDNRPGTTDRELATWLEANPDDVDIAHAAELVRGTVDAWRQGELTSDEALVALYGHERGYEGKLSETALAVLNQARMWFGYEADMPVDRQFEIEEAAEERHQQEQERAQYELWAQHNPELAQQ